MPKSVVASLRGDVPVHVHTDVDALECKPFMPINVVF